MDENEQVEEIHGDRDAAGNKVNKPYTPPNRDKMNEERLKKEDPKVHK